MAASNTDLFKKAKRKFSTTVGAGGFAQGATTLPLTTTTGLDTDTAITLMLDPGGATEEVITGVVSGSDIINCVRGKEGTTDQDHSAGDAVSMYFTETHWDDAMTGILAEHAQDGSHTDITADTIEATTGTFTNGVFDNLTINGTATEEGWSPLGDTPDTVTANGGKSYSLVFNGNDLTDSISPGMRLKLTRTVTAPTQCTDLESGSSQYYSKTSPSGCTFTDDFTCMAWIKVESATAGIQTIISRYNGTSGWLLYLNSYKQVVIQGTNASNTDSATSHATVPIGKWVHVAATLDMSGATATIYIDGVAVSNTYANGSATTLVQAGNLQVGAYNGATGLFDGKIAQAAVFSAVLSASTIKSYMSQTLSGSETNIVSAYSFNNSINDLSANANNLTANGGAAATATDTPFAGGATGTTEYAVVTAITFSTNTTITALAPNGYAIPTSGGVSAVSYSTHAAPLGYPMADIFYYDANAWQVVVNSFGALQKYRKRIVFSSVSVATTPTSITSSFNSTSLPSAFTNWGDAYTLQLDCVPSSNAGCLVLHPEVAINATAFNIIASSTDSTRNYDGWLDIVITV